MGGWQWGVVTSDWNLDSDLFYKFSVDPDFVLVQRATEIFTHSFPVGNKPSVVHLLSPQSGRIPATAYTHCPLPLSHISSEWVSWESGDEMDAVRK